MFTLNNLSLKLLQWQHVSYQCTGLSAADAGACNSHIEGREQKGLTVSVITRSYSHVTTTRQQFGLLGVF